MPVQQHLKSHTGTDLIQSSEHLVVSKRVLRHMAPAACHPQAQQSTTSAIPRAGIVTSSGQCPFLNLREHSP